MGKNLNFFGRPAQEFVSWRGLTLRHSVVNQLLLSKHVVTRATVRWRRTIDKPRLIPCTIQPVQGWSWSNVYVCPLYPVSAYVSVPGAMTNTSVMKNEVTLPTLLSRTYPLDIPSFLGEYFLEGGGGRAMHPSEKMRLFAFVLKINYSNHNLMIPFRCNSHFRTCCADIFRCSRSDLLEFFWQFFFIQFPINSGQIMPNPLLTVVIRKVILWFVHGMGDSCFQ